MPLESGDFISDLDPNNPVGAIDPVSQGDDHLRLIKKTIVQTFPNINAAMTLTDEQLNAAFVTNEPTTVEQPTTFLESSIYEHTKGVAGEDTTSVARNMARVSALNILELGDTGLPETRISAGAVIKVFANAADVAEFVPFAAGALNLLDVDGVTSGRAVAEHFDNIFSGTNTFETDTNFLNDIGIAPTFWLKTRNVANTSDIFLMRIDDSGNVICGDIDEPFQARGNPVNLVHNGALVANTLAVADGSFNVLNRLGQDVLAGFRHIRVRSIIANHTFQQVDEGRILEITTATAPIMTCGALEQGTTIRLLASAVNLQIQPGSGVSIRLFDATGAQSAAFINANRGAVVELVWTQTNEVVVFGNGLSK